MPQTEHESCFSSGDKSPKHSTKCEPPVPSPLEDFHKVLVVSSIPVKCLPSGETHVYYRGSEGQESQKSKAMYFYISESLPDLLIFKRLKYMHIHMMEAPGFGV